MSYTRKRTSRGGVIGKRPEFHNKKVMEDINVLYYKIDAQERHMKNTLSLIRQAAAPRMRNNPERIRNIQTQADKCKSEYKVLWNAYMKLLEMSDLHRHVKDVIDHVYFSMGSVLDGLYTYALCMAITTNAIKERHWLHETNEAIENMKDMKGIVDKFFQNHPEIVREDVDSLKSKAATNLDKMQGIVMYAERAIEENTIINMLDKINPYAINICADALQHIREIAGHRMRTTQNGRLLHEEGRELDKEVEETLEKIEVEVRQGLSFCKKAEKIALDHPEFPSLSTLAMMCYNDTASMMDMSILARVIVANKIHKDDPSEKRKYLVKAEIYTSTMEKMIPIIDTLAKNENEVFIRRYAVDGENIKRRIEGNIIRAKNAIRIAKKTPSLMAEREAEKVEEESVKAAKKNEKEKKKQVKALVNAEWHNMVASANAMVSLSRPPSRSMRRQSVHRPHNQPIGGYRT